MLDGGLLQTASLGLANPAAEVDVLPWLSTALRLALSSPYPPPPPFRALAEGSLRRCEPPATRHLMWRYLACDATSRV